MDRTKQKRFGWCVAEKSTIGKNLNKNKNNVVLSCFFNYYKMFRPKKKEINNHGVDYVVGTIPLRKTGEYEGCFWTVS